MVIVCLLETAGETFHDLCVFGDYFVVEYYYFTQAAIDNLCKPYMQHVNYPVTLHYVVCIVVDFFFFFGQDKIIMQL